MSASSILSCLLNLWEHFHCPEISVYDKEDLALRLPPLQTTILSSKDQFSFTSVMTNSLNHIGSHTVTKNMKCS